MKYKKQIATGALAFSLLIAGSPVFATTPQDLGIKNVGKVYQKQNKSNAGLNKKNSAVGTVSALTGAGFTVSVTNLKTKIASSMDVVTNASTVYKKDGLVATASDLALGQKVIVVGSLDKTANVLSAKTVKIVTTPSLPKVKKTTKN